MPREAPVTRAVFPESVVMVWFLSCWAGFRAQSAVRGMGSAPLRGFGNEKVGPSRLCRGHASRVSARGLATVHSDDLASDVAGLVGRDEDHAVRDFLRRGPSLQGDGGEEYGLPVWRA